MYFTDDKTHLLTAKKRPKNKTSNYIIGSSRDKLTKKSPFFLGKLRSNFLGTEFNIYDNGNNPKNTLAFESIRK